MAFPLSPFAHPVGSFQQPVPAPTNSVGVCDQVAVTFDSKWLPYVLGALTQLTLQSTWQGTDEEIAAILGDAWALLAQFQKATCVPAPQTGATEVDFDMGIRVDCNCRVWVTCCDGTEVEILTSKNPGPGQPGAGSPLPKPGGGTAEYCFKLPPRTLAQLPTTVNSGDTILISGAKGSWNDGSSLFWYCPSGWQFLLNTCNPTSIVDVGQLLVSSRYMGIIAKIGMEYFDVYNPDSGGNPQVFVVPPGIVNQTVQFISNNFSGPVEFYPGGDVEFCVTVTNNTPGTWTQTFDFALSQFDTIWQPVSYPGSTPTDAAVYAAGQYWHSQHLQSNSTPYSFRLTDIFENVPCHLTKVTVYAEWTVGSDTSGLTTSEGTGIIVINGSFVAGTYWPTTPTFPLVWTGDIMATSVEFGGYSGADNTSTDPGGDLKVTKIVFEGIGANPFA